MKKLIVSSLAAGSILCGVGVANACHYAYNIYQIATSSWADGSGTTHEYVFYRFQEVRKGRLLIRDGRPPTPGCKIT